MADIARLGIAVESSQAEKGAISLQKLSGAARMAEQATKGTATGSRAAAQANAAVAGSADAAAASLTRQAGAARQAAVAVNDNARRMGGSMSGLAAQFQDIGVTAAMDMNPMIIGLQQGTQIAGQMEAAMQGGASAVSVLGTAFKSLFSPLTFVAIALTALTALGLQMVDWPAAGAAALRMLASALDAVAPYAAAASAALALMFAPALLSGAWALVTAITAIGTAAIRAAASFTAAWLAALGPAGWFFLALGAATIAIYAFRDELADILGFDVVDAARRGANAIIGVLVGGFRAARVVWDGFPDVMDEVGAMAMHRFMEQVRLGLRQLVMEINLAIDSISKNIGIALPTLGNHNKLFPSQKGPAMSERGSAAMDATSAAFNGAQGKDYVGMITDGIANGAGLASDKLRELAEWLGIVDEKDKKRRGKTDAEKYSDIVDGANRRIASLKAEQAALGMTEEAAAALRYETDLLNEAQQKGITLTAAQKAELAGLAAQMASIEVATRKAKEAMEFAKDVTRGFMEDMRYGLESGEGFWKSFANAALNALDKITDKLLNDVLDALFQVNGAGGGGAGGIIGSIVSGIFGGGFKQTGSWAAANAGFASGTANTGGARGEARGIVHGQEAVIPLPSGGRVPVQLHGAANSNHPAAYNDNRVYHFTGTSEEFQQFKEFVAQRDAQFDARAVNAVKGYHSAGNSI